MANEKKDEDVTRAPRESVDRHNNCTTGSTLSLIPVCIYHPLKAVVSGMGINRSLTVANRQNRQTKKEGRGRQSSMRLSLSSSARCASLGDEDVCRRQDHGYSLSEASWWIAQGPEQHRLLALTPPNPRQAMLGDNEKCVNGTKAKTFERRNIHWYVEHLHIAASGNNSPMS